MRKAASHAAEVIAHIAGLYSGKGLQGDPTQLYTTGHYVWMAQQVQEFAKAAKLEDLAEMAPQFAADLGLLRRSADSAGDAEQDQPSVIEQCLATARLLAWLDAMMTFGLLTPGNHRNLRSQVIDLGHPEGGDTQGEQG